MRENRTSGSVQGAPGNRRSYCETCHSWLSWFFFWLLNTMFLNSMFALPILCQVAYFKEASFIPRIARGIMGLTILPFPGYGEGDQGCRVALSRIMQGKHSWLFEQFGLLPFTS